MAVTTQTKLRIKSGSLELEFEGSEAFLRSDVHKLVKAVNDLPTSNVVLAAGILKRELEVSLSTLGELERQIEESERDLDSIGDLTDVMQTRLQLYMDRRQRAMETLTNLVKKLSETASVIIQNLK